jgi:hypothetical protein
MIEIKREVTGRYRMVMTNRVNELKRFLPITKGVCVFAPEPPNKVTVNEIEAEQGNSHQPTSLLVNRGTVHRGPTFPQYGDGLGCNRQL